VNKVSSSNPRSNSTTDLGKCCVQAFDSLGLPKELRKEARAFVDTVHTLLISDDSPAHTPDLVDKAHRLSDTPKEVAKMFYSPEFFSKSSWGKLDSEKKLQIIHAGLKVLGPMIESYARKGMPRE